MRHRKIERPKFGEHLHEFTLDNGLRAWLIQRKGYIHKCALLVFDYGSLYVRFRIDGRTYETPFGIAHLLEHRLFEKEYGSIFDKFADYGADANAFTSYSATGYHFDCTDHFYECLQLLIRGASNLYLTEDALNKEKEVVICELKESQENPGNLLHRNLLNALYATHPVKVDIAGTVESVKNIDCKAMYLAHNIFYRPRNSILVAAGDIEPKRFIEVVSESSSEWKDNGKSPEIIIPKEPMSAHRHYVRAKTQMARHKVAVAFKDSFSPSDKTLARRIFAAELASACTLGHSSEDYQTLYQEGIIDDTFSAAYLADRYFGYFVFSCDTDKPRRFVQSVKDVISKRKREGFKKEEFERLKKRALGALLASLDSLSHTVSLLAIGQMFGHLYLDTLKLLTSLTPDNVLSVLKEVCTEKKCAVSVVSPLSDGKST